MRQGVVSQTSEVIEGTQKRYAVSENNIVSTESGMAVEISLDSEIQVELSNATPEERGEIVERVLKQAMLEEGSYEFHDGTKAIMDNKDIAKVGHSKNEIKNRSSVSMKDLVKVARIYAEDWNISHKKFSGFKYYRARVIIEGELYECSLNVGYGKFDKQYHIYDVNQFENAKRSDSPILSNPRKSVEQTVSRTITSKDSITDSTENVNRNAEKSSEISENFDTSDLDTYARENIKDYDKLSAPNQAEIRAMIREGRALGMSDSDVLLYAKISARTGVRVTFDKGKTLIGRRKGTKELVYADGFYDPATNEICVNPNGKRSADKLLIHELAHAIYGGEKGMRLAKRNVKNLSAEEKKAISDRYAEVERTDEIELLDEYNAHYAEGILGNAETLERLLDDAPTVKDRILDFLRGAKGDTDAQRSAAARRLFFKYKRLFDKFAQQNAQNIAAERMPTASVTDAEKKTPHGEAPEAGARYALPYDDAIDQLDNDTLNTTQNTHLRVLDHTPPIYIEKAGASNREIVMSWDIAYLAMKKDGDLQGNYHGLGTDIMKALPRALEDPLYIVKQKNGRLAAVTRIVVKGKRAVFASIELEAFQTTIQEGTTESKKYNLVVTVTDAKPNYLQNTIFGGEIVHNKNSEDPAHFILRLKSLEKATPTYDHAGSSKDSIPDLEEKVNRNPENSSKRRLALPQNTDTAKVTAEFAEELKAKLAKESARENEIDLARAKAEDAAAKEISRVKKREAKRADYWKEKAKENESRAKVLGNISSLAGKMKDLKLGTYHNATQMQNSKNAAEVKNSIAISKKVCYNNFVYFYNFVYLPKGGQKLWRERKSSRNISSAVRSSIRTA